jgi:Zn finger protein HypA/HybF involved in hydrogenase expression
MKTEAERVMINFKQKALVMAEVDKSAYLSSLKGNTLFSCYTYMHHSLMSLNNTYSACPHCQSPRIIIDFGELIIECKSCLFRGSPPLPPALTTQMEDLVAKTAEFMPAQQQLAFLAAQCSSLPLRVCFL